MNHRRCHLPAHVLPDALCRNPCSTISAAGIGSCGSWCSSSSACSDGGFATCRCASALGFTVTHAAAAELLALVLVALAARSAFNRMAVIQLWHSICVRA